jgi:hypothetical protein
VLVGGEHFALLIAGQPPREPVAARRGFVLNIDVELMEAFAEFPAQGDRFGINTLRRLTS